MKKILLLLAMLLNAPLQASEPTTQDIIQLPRGLAYSVGLNNIPTGVLLLMSRFLFGTTDKNKFWLAKKGRTGSMMEISYTYSDIKNDRFINGLSKLQKIINKKNTIENSLWITPCKLDYPRPKMMYSIPGETMHFHGYTKTLGEFTHIDEVFWIAEQDCLCLKSKDKSIQSFEVSFLSKFCCIQPYKAPKNMMMCRLYSKNLYKKIVKQYYIDHGEEHEYITSANQAYYKPKRYSRDLYAHIQMPSYQYLHTFEQLIFANYD